MPALQDGVEIASIAFDPQGRMYLAERGATTGDYFRYNLANGGASRVLRYVPAERQPLLLEQVNLSFCGQVEGAVQQAVRGLLLQIDRVVVASHEEAPTPAVPSTVG